MISHYLIAIICVSFGALVVNIMNPEVRYMLLRFITGDHSDALEKALATKQFPSFQYKNISISGQNVSEVWGGRIEQSPYSGMVFVKFTDERVANWIESSFNFKLWMGSKRVRLGRCFYTVIKMEREGNTVTLFVLKSRERKWTRYFFGIQFTVMFAMFGLLIHGAIRSQDSSMLLPVVYGATIFLIISALSLYARGTK